LTRTLAALAKFAKEPEVSDLWLEIERSFTVQEIADIEIIEPSIQIEGEVTIPADESLAKALYALCWSRFERALVDLNDLYNTTPGDAQNYRFNRIKR